MSASKARKFYKSLDPQQKRFVEDKTISTSLPVKHWITFLIKASAYDTYADNAVANSVGWIVLSVLATLATGFTYFSYGQLWFIVVPAAFALLSYGLILRRINFKKRDINNYLRSFFMPFLELMRIKAGSEAKLSASLDFRNPTKAFTPVKSTVRGRKLETYQPKYIIAKVTLLDGAYLEIVIADDIKIYNYRSASGKPKSKTKTTHHFFIRLSVPKSVYKRKDQMLPYNVTVEEQGEEFVFKLKGKHKDNGYLILAPKIFLTGLQSLYHQVEEINPTAKPVAETGEATQVKRPASKDFTDGTSSADSTLPYLLWSDSLFNRTDYDSTQDRGDIPMIVEEDSKMNVFES